MTKLWPAFLSFHATTVVRDELDASGVKSQIGLQPGLEVLDIDIAPVLRAAPFTRRHQHLVEHLDDAVLGNAVSDGNVRKAVDADGRQAAEADDVDGNVSVAEQRRELVVAPLQPLGSGLLPVRVRLVVVRVGVQGGVGDDVVLEQGTQVFVARLGVEEEGVCPDAQPLEGVVAGGQDGAANQVDAADVLDKVGFFIREQQRRELGREEGEGPPGPQGGDEDVVDGVDDAIRRFLHGRALLARGREPEGGSFV